MEETSHNELSLSYAERKSIIKFYALRICLVEEDYEQRAHDIIDRLKNHKIRADDATAEIFDDAVSTAHLLSKLMIEQFYNTGDDEMFDRALMLDENVMLDEFSVIGMDDDVDEIPGRTIDDGVVVPYEGVFIYFSNKEGPHTAKKVKIVYRDPEEVEKINKKLERGRILLNVDQVTLGKKYYQGLCMRTHFH